MVYLITYDLNKPRQAYEATYEAIKGLGETCWPLGSVWFLDTQESLETVCAKLEASPAFDGNDEYYVVACEDGSGRIKPAHDKWFHESLIRTRLSL